MNLSDFDYHLPEGLIAQYPLPERDASRLLVLLRKDGAMRHERFCDLCAWLRPGDLLVLNDTKVVPARLEGQRRGGGRTEVLLVEEDGPNRWWVLGKPGKGLAVGRRLIFPEGIRAEVVDRAEGGRRLLQFEGLDDILAVLCRIGMMPLPPYLTRGGGMDDRARDGAVDTARYQTVYATEPGAIAAPTAGLHFTPARLAEVEELGVKIAFLTLHVGVGTFAPVTAEQVEEHWMAPERYTIPEATAAGVKRAKADGRRVVAVGTTTTRALEDAARKGDGVRAGAGMASLFITPGYRFQVVDALLTNFHLPRSTLFMLVSAFAGRDMIHAAYAEAIQARYRFYSYGDAMLIL